MQSDSFEVASEDDKPGNAFPDKGEVAAEISPDIFAVEPWDDMLVIFLHQIIIPYYNIAPERVCCGWCNAPKLVRVAKCILLNLQLSMRKALLLLISLALCSCYRMPVYPEARSNEAGVIIPVSGLPEKRPVFYTYYHGKKKINYFVLKLDGKINAYFDACAKCYPKKLGYLQDRERVVCRACDVNYSLHDLKDGIGSCYPIKLPGKLQGKAEEEVYLIDKKDLILGEKYF